MLREVIVKIGLESIDTQKQITVEILLDGGATELVISSEFTRKKGFKTKKIENIYYQGHRERIVKFINSGLIFSLFYSHFHFVSLLFYFRT